MAVEKRAKPKKRKNKQAQEETRFRVADYLRKKKGTQKEAAGIFGITERAVSGIWAKYKGGGRRALNSKKRGAIVNSSRSFGILAKDFISDIHTNDQIHPAEITNIQTRLIYRHIAWLTSLKYQLRQPKKWENLDKNYNAEYRKKYNVHELENNLEEDLSSLLETEELAYILSKKNRATQIIAMQSKDIKTLRKRNLTDDFRHVEIEALLIDLYTQQGKCERIKNFPYPRQFATLNLFFVWLFVFLVPFGLMTEFDSLGANFVWMTIPFSLLVSWVFHTMEKIGGVTENPFEGGPNDIPMAALSRTMEIDLRDMLDEAELLDAIEEKKMVLPLYLWVEVQSSMEK